MGTLRSQQFSYHLKALINAITRFGLFPDINIDEEKEELLEYYLVNLYMCYFDVEYEFDETDYPDIDITSMFPAITDNVRSNFDDFECYIAFLNIIDVDSTDEISIGMAIDDLSDIITDLLEVKWRMENNSVADGLWYFDHSFDMHLKFHVINLLNYLRERRWQKK